MPLQLWLADIARDAGLAVVEVDGWRERGNPSFNPGGMVEHHTAGARTGDIPSLRVLIEGRSDLAGPLCNYGMARSGTVYVIAAGRANHAGAGGWQGMVGNSSVVGVEYENAGGAGDPWPAVQLEAGVVLTAAVMERLGRDTKYVAEHKEWAPSRKVDRHTITGTWWREQVENTRGGDMPLNDADLEKIRQLTREEINAKVVASEWQFHKPRYSEILKAIKAVASGSADAEKIVDEIFQRLATLGPDA